jgi:beta-galactosidase/beta-glucuronidase
MIVRRTGRPGSAARPVAARVEELEGRVLLATGPLPPAWQPKTPILSTQWTSQVSTVNALPEYPRPQMVRADWQNLNGEWQFARDTTGGADVPIDRNLAESILVPFPVESALSGVNRRESRMWYRRTFSVPAAWAGQRILLNFGAVNWRSTVYVNGVSVGTHFGGYDSFAYDITPHLNGGTNELIVGVYSPADGDGVGQPIGKQRNNPGGIFYTAASGIWQTVWLEPVPAARITRVDTTPDIDNKTVQVVVHGSGIAGQTVQASVLQGGVQVGVGTGAVGSPITINLPNPQLWSPDYPFLYDLNVSLVSGSTTVDRVGSYFGMRKISLGMAGGVLRPMLNNQFVFQMGPLDQGYWPDGIYTAPTDAALRFDLEQEKALGYNVVRKHVKVEPARWYYWADKLGLMVWQDMPSMFPTGSPTTAQRQQFELELREMVDEHRSDTSIVMWVPFNEGWGQYDTARIANLVKSWDPSRLVNNASGWNDAGAGDVIDIHQYVGPASPTPTATRAAVLGEFGGLGLKVPGHEWDPSRSFGYEMEPDAATLTSRYVGLIRDVQTLMTSQGLKA